MYIDADSTCETIQCVHGPYIHSTNSELLATAYIMAGPLSLPEDIMKLFLRLSILLLLVLGSINIAQAQDDRVDEFPVPYGPSNMGRDFWVAFPANWDVPESKKYYVRLYITSLVRTQVKVWAGPGIKKVLFTVPGEISTVTLTPVEAQMFLRSDQSPPSLDRIFKGKAIHIHAEAPIAVYGMNTTTQTADGMLLLPTNALGRRYIIASMGAYEGLPYDLPSQYMVIAPYNGTTVTIYQPHNSRGHAAGETFTIQLDSGDVWSSMSVGYNGDVSGVIISSSKPVVVTAGNLCTKIPNLLGYCCCDHLEEMMIPTESWGKVYHGVPIYQRLRGDIYRVFTKEPNTTVYINGVEYATLNGVGGQEGNGWFEFRALGKGVQEFVADKPIFVVQFNTSYQYDGLKSDPFYLALIPQEQYGTSMLFSTPDGDHPGSFINLVCEEESYENVEISPVDRDDWKPISTTATTDPTKEFPTRIDGKKYKGITFPITKGAYRLRSTTPFGAYMYEPLSNETYGYPLGAFMRNLTGGDVDPPILTSTQDCNGTITASVGDMPDNDNIRSGLASVELHPDVALTSNYALMQQPFDPGIASVAGYRLEVIDKTIPARARVIISDMAGNTTYDNVMYNPRHIAVLPLVREYGKVRLGEHSTQKVTISNESDEPIRLREIMLKNKAQGFAITTPPGERVLGAKGSVNASMEVDVEFTAVISRSGAQQVYEDSVGVRDSCGLLRYMAVVRAQVVKPMIKVTDHEFGRLPINVESTSWQLEVKNSSVVEGSTLRVTGVNGLDEASVFDVKSGTALQVPFTLEPGESRNLQIRAYVLEAGAYTDTLYFTSDAMDVVDGDTYSWLRVLGDDELSTVEHTSGELTIGSTQVLPNPAGGSEAELSYTLSRRGMVEIELIDASGRTVRELIASSQLEAGIQQLKVDLRGISGGTYFVRIKAGDEHRLVRLVIAR